MDFSIINEAIPIEDLKHPLTLDKGVSLKVLRLDKTHPSISGNKWFKLKYNLQKASQLGHSTLLTFGGAYSNHIYAVAGAANLFGFKAIGIIRGEEHSELNPTLKFAKEQGMQLKYIDRQSYRKKNEASFLEKLRDEFGEFYHLPEGGTNELAIEGASEILGQVEEEFDYYCLPVGTGGTIAGIISCLRHQKKVIGFSALKGSFLEKEVESLLTKYSSEKFNNWIIDNEYHFGGYAKTKPELLKFIHEFEADYEIPLEPIYTGKMLFGILDKIDKNHFQPGSKILAIHTGGQQGRAGFGL